MHEYTSTARVWGLSCPGFPEEVSRARRWTRDILRGSPLADDAELIVSELSSNAILHTASGAEAGSFHLALAVSPQVIALSVTDDGGTSTAPKVENQDQHAEHGRGLGMVTALAHRVVVHNSHGTGFTVTAELFTTAHPEGTPW
ncbi:MULTISPECIES: ATP-binding protein [unclassified Streptomyces]|uniref:ATP-binding protein n=1 Tax=unclassified Streptomyces TaxID=2593676 RepID=UPI001489FD41|nr:MULTISPECIES: ATP-binding protein [unclassified Streptomyces]